MNSIKISSEFIITLDVKLELVVMDGDDKDHIFTVYYTTGDSGTECFQVNEKIENGFIQYYKGHLYDVVTSFVKEKYSKILKKEKENKQCCPQEMTF